MAETVTVQKTVVENGDSLTLGAPTNGQVKVYGDFSKPQVIEEKLKNALDQLASAVEYKRAKGL